MGTQKLHEARSGLVITKLLSFRGRRALSLRDLTRSSGDFRWVGLNPISGRAETVIKSQFGDVELSIGDSIFGPVVLFLTGLNTTGLYT